MFFELIKRKLKLFLFKFLNIKISIIKKNIYKNISSPEKIVLDTLYNSKGIIHIGAHRGSERFIYDWLGKNVIWVEANPKIFYDLQVNISEFKYQKAFNYLLHSSIGKKINFYLSSNDGASSSIYEFSKDFKEKKIHFENKVRNIYMNKKVTLISNTLDNLIKEHDVEISKFDHLVIDVQGAELDVLKGSSNFLNKCKTIYIEISTENFYQDGSNWNDVRKFLNKKKFKEARVPIKNHDDIVFFKV